VKANLRTEIGLKFNLTDTAAAFTPYTRVTRFLDSLLAHTSRFDAVTTALAGKQATLVSGTNIKTVNGNTLLGSGDLTIAGGSGDTSTFIVDTLHTPLAMVVGTDTVWLRSVRFRKNGTLVSPTLTDSTGDWNFTIDTTDITSFSVKVRALFSATGPLTYANGNLSLDTTSGKWRSEAYYDTKYALIGGGGGGAPSGNYGNGVVIRNGALEVPGGDSLDFDAGLYIKGVLSATALPTGGVAADSVVVINSSGAFKKRNAAAFVTTNGTTTAGQLALVNGTGTIYSSSKFVYSDATYPSFSIIGSDPLMYFGGTGAAYPSIGKSGGSTVMYGTSGGRSINFYDQLIGGRQMLRLYATAAGASAVFGKTALSIDTAVGGPSIGSVHVEYNAGDSTSSATDVGRHMFRGIGRTYANSGSFNTFYSTVEAGNTTYSQDHIIAWQSDAKKTGANTLGIIYHLGILGDSIKAGTVNNRWGVYMYDAKVTAGATLAHQSALRVPKLAAGVRNYDMFSDSAQTVKMDGNILLGDSSLATSARKTLHIFNGTAPSSNISGSILYSESGELKVRNSAGAINLLSGNAVFSGTLATADPGSGSGSWKLGTAVTTSGLTLNTTTYVEISIGGTVYRLAVVDPPSPNP